MTIVKKTKGRRMCFYNYLGWQTLTIWSGMPGTYLVLTWKDDVIEVFNKMWVYLSFKHPIMHYCIQNWFQEGLYRVSRNTLATYVFAIYRLPGHLEIKSWKFSWSPFNSDFKTVLILIPSIIIDQIITLLR